MNQALAMVESIGVLFIIAFVGLIARRAGLLGESVIKGVTALLLFVSQPALMLSVTQQSHNPGMLSAFLLAAGVTYVFLGALQGIAYALFKRKGEKLRAVMAIVAVMPNVGFFGIPIIESLYGAEGLLYLAAFIIGFNLSLWTVSVTLFTGFQAKSLLNLISPTFIAVVIGTALFALNIALPALLRRSIDSIASINTPLSMMLMGARLEALRPRDLIDKNLWITSLCKLVAMPLAMMGVLKLLGLHGMMASVMVLAASMPSGANTQMFAERYDRDAAFAAKGISVTTLLCAVTLPLINLFWGV